jgi:hypothetical protein
VTTEKWILLMARGYSLIIRYIVSVPVKFSWYAAIHPVHYTVLLYEVFRQIRKCLCSYTLILILHQSYVLDDNSSTLCMTVSDSVLLVVIINKLKTQNVTDVPWKNELNFVNIILRLRWQHKLSVYDSIRQCTVDCKY